MDPFMPLPLDPSHILLTDEDLTNRFLYHPPRNADDRLRHTLISERTLELAKFLRDVVPHSRELSQALTDLENCRMHANQGVACNHDKLPPA